MEKMALGLIETVGLVAALEAADAAVKSANVILIGYELTKGGGLVTIKLEGDVGAVNAAIQAGCAAAEKLNRVYSRKVIPRPHSELRPMISTIETVGAHRKDAVSEPGSEDVGAAAAKEAPAEPAEVDPEVTEPPVEEKKKMLTCNLCNDIRCTRVKGDLKRRCIHYFDR